MESKSVRRIAAALALVLCLTLFGGMVPETTAQAATTTAKKSSLEKKAEKIVSAQVKEGTRKQTALKTLFKYVEENYSYARTVTTNVEKLKNTAGWEKNYALSIMRKKKGTCYHYAAAYAFLAKEATGLPVRVVLGQTNGFSGKWQDHAWTEIKISGKWYVFDTNMDKYAANSKLKYYRKSTTSSLYKKTYKAAKKITVKY